MFSGACSAHSEAPLCGWGWLRTGSPEAVRSPTIPEGCGADVTSPRWALAAPLLAPRLFNLSFRQPSCVHWQCFSNALLEQRIPCVREKHQLCLLRFMLNPGWAHPKLETFSAP